MRGVRVGIACWTLLALAACGSGGGGGGGGGGGDDPDPEALANLAISHGTLTPAFDPDVVDYFVGPAPVPASVTLTPTTAVEGATVTVNGAATASGSPSAPIALSLGLNVATVVVTAPGGFMQRTYTVEIDRTTADLASLAVSAGALDPAFHPAFTSYLVDAPLATSTTITAATVDPTAILIIEDQVASSGDPTDPFDLPLLVTTFTVQVIPRGGLPKTYSVAVDRTPNALFFDDFSSSPLEDWWSGTGSLDGSFGSPAPSLSLTAGQTLECIDGPFSTASDLTFTVDGQRVGSMRLKVLLFQDDDPANRWISMELYGTTLAWTIGGDDAPSVNFQGPISANDEAFHVLQIQIGADGSVAFSLDGTPKGGIGGGPNSFPVTDLRFSLSNASGAGGSTDVVRFDEVTVTSP